MDIVVIDSTSDEDSNGGLFVDSGQNPNLKCRFGARHSDCKVDFVESNGKRLIFDLTTTPNR